MLHGLKIVVGITGGIAAYKTCTLVSRLVRAQADVRVVMTAHATEFVSPLTFETLSKHRVVVETFDRDFEWEVEHVSLAASADLFVVAPATANFIAKFANGIADDFLTTTATAMKCPVLVCPAMNFRMLGADATRANLATLEKRGVGLLYGGSGALACGETGEGRMAEPEAIFDAVCGVLLPKRDFVGKKVLVTAGGTREDIDGVRCLANYSSGRMGAALADAFRKRGAEVTVVRAHVDVKSRLADRFVDVETTQEMFDAVTRLAPEVDIIVKAAAPADYRVERPAANKIKGERVTLELVKNPDIAAAVGRTKRPDQKLVIFCAETEKLLENARQKLTKKGADMVVANDVRADGAGFEVETNIVTIITKDREISVPKCQKSEVAERILDALHDC